MLFAATSINYMDRQVIAILKPTLEHTIGMTEVGYGNIVDAFQIAYAIGLLAAGRFVDRVGTRIGYMVVMAVWSLSAMGHALASTVFEFGIARFFLGLGESGNFPAAIKTVAEWFPQSERSLATGIFNSGSNVGAILAPIIVPWLTLRYGWQAAFLVTGGFFSALWILWWYRVTRNQMTTPRSLPLSCATSTRAQRRRRALPRRGANCLATARPGHSRSPSFSPIQSGGFISSGCLLTSARNSIWTFRISGCRSSSFITPRSSEASGEVGYPLRSGVLGLSPSYARLAAMLFCACMVVPIFAVTYLKTANGTSSR